MKTAKLKRISPCDLHLNFTEVDEGLSARQAFEESNRCLYCYDAPCTNACPTSIDIPSFIKKIASGNLIGSARTIMKANPVGASCARVCPTEELCEGACVLNSSTAPIQIGKLQRYTTDWAIENKPVLFEKGMSNGLKVAIIGSGPAGLSAARELALLGYVVTIYEASHEAGGLNTFGIVSFRLPQKISFWEVNQVKELGVRIETNTEIGKDLGLGYLQDHFDYIVVAVGMGSVPSLGIEGEHLTGVLDAIDFVKSTKGNQLTEDYKGKRMVVIGAGNTAIDAATCSVRLGAENVQILYRRTAEEMTAYDFEYEFAKQDGVEFRWLTAPKRIIGDGIGNVTGIECQTVALHQEEKDGRRRPIPIKGSEYVIPCDAIIKAIGQTRHVSLIHALGLDHKNGVVTVNPDSYQTSNGKIYACGDVIFGKGTGEAMVVSAAQQGKNVAESIHKSLMDAQLVQ
ncbi:NAD(P)-dependent oxidoreductase [Bacillus sp. 1P06AnD]|uniref:NAD(P)-dependent oxidoreductase n=1 Tax=Bacillus sp. 1P06AnD TaxID=3132208 RepID=UPI0039A3703C